MVQTLDRPSQPVVRDHNRRRKGAFYFGWHFAEMCAAMCLAWMLVTLPFIAIAHSTGTADPIRAWPEAVTVLAAVVMSAGMAAQMRWRRHTWRCIAEMAAAMFAEAVILIALAATGAIDRTHLFVWYHALMPIAMVAAMVLRLDLYTRSPVSGHGHGTASTSTAH